MSEKALDQAPSLAVEKNDLSSDFEVRWEENDPDNPMNWPLWYKSFIIAMASLGTTVV